MSVKIENTETPKPDETPAPQEPPAADPPGLDELDSVLDEVAANVPPVEPHFVEKIQGMSKPTPPENIDQDSHKPPKDREGYYFDAEFCEVDENGDPKYSKTGLFVMRRKYRKKSNKAKYLKKRLIIPASGAAADPAGMNAAPVDVQRLECETLASVCDSMFWAISGFVFPETGKKNPQVSAAGIGATTEYFLTCQDLPKLPAWAPVAAIYGTAFAQIAAAPEAKPRRETIKEKLQFVWWKLTKKKRGA